MNTTVINKKTGQVVVPNCKVARTVLARLVGLMGSTHLNSDSALWIEPCNSVHTFFMRYTIDVVYLDKQGRVIDVCAQVSPWRVHLPVSKAKVALELPSGGAALAGIKTGEVLCLS